MSTLIGCGVKPTVPKKEKPSNKSTLDKGILDNETLENILFEYERKRALILKQVGLKINDINELLAVNVKDGSVPIDKIEDKLNEANITYEVLIDEAKKINVPSNTKKSHDYLLLGLMEFKSAIEKTLKSLESRNPSTFFYTFSDNTIKGDDYIKKSDNIFDNIPEIKIKKELEIRQKIRDEIN